MHKRFVALWFPHLQADWLMLRRPGLKDVPFAFVKPDQGRVMITAASIAAEAQNITAGMRAADAKAMVPGLELIDDHPGRPARLLKGIGEWCIRYSPIVAVDAEDGLIIEASGCTHLWGGEEAYLKEIVSRLNSKGYAVRVAMADTVGTAWAVCRFAHNTPIIERGEQGAALLALPAAALRLEEPVLQRLQKLGFYQIRSFIGIPRSVLRRRFGESLLLRLGQALGQEDEVIQPLQPPVHYGERLPCPEPVRTRTAIEIAITRLLENLCLRLQQDGRGLRKAVLSCYRIDGKIEQVGVGTNRPLHSVSHLYKLLELQISRIMPALGIELFVLEAPMVEIISPAQEALWAGKQGLEDQNVAELLDRLAGKIGAGAIHRYLPVEHFWPERSIKEATILEKPGIDWRNDKPRPTQLLFKPEPIEVTSLIPDYPPMLFIYKGIRHQVKKADGPERIEREWWLDKGEHRDYYHVEDEEGQRYWLFRSGHYEGQKRYQWFLHGFFA